jgi:single-strand DNA-binding protein
MNYNKVVVVGRVTQAPQLRITPAGQSVLSMSVATNRAWTDKQGAKQEAVEFHNVVIWGKTAETASAYLDKGSLVLVEGHLETRTWKDKQDVTRKSTEIIADSVQFGPRAGTKEQAEKVVQTGDDEPVINLEEEEIKPEDIPF